LKKFIAADAKNIQPDTKNKSFSNEGSQS